MSELHFLSFLKQGIYLLDKIHNGIIYKIFYCYRSLVEAKLLWDGKNSLGVVYTGTWPGPSPLLWDNDNLSEKFIPVGRDGEYGDILTVLTSSTQFMSQILSNQWIVVLSHYSHY